MFVSVQWKMRLIQIGLYMLVPFFFTQCVCLGILLTETGRRNIWLTECRFKICGMDGLFFIAVMHLNRIDNKVMTLASMILSGALGFLSILEVCYSF